MLSENDELFAKRSQALLLGSKSGDILEGVEILSTTHQKERLDASWNKALEKAVEIVLESDLVSKQVKDNLVRKIKSHVK